MISQADTTGNLPIFGESRKKQNALQNSCRHDKIVILKGDRRTLVGDAIALPQSTLRSTGDFFIMPQNIFKPNQEKLKNAVAAVVGRAISSIKRFATALHNKCNLVVFTDAVGRTCSTFLRRDAFTGYDFQFSGDKCVVTNKATGDIYTVAFGRCSCPAFKFSPKEECKHQRMIAELKGELEIEQVIAQTELNQYIEQQSSVECTHSRAITGLDCHYCPDCKKSIEYGTAAYEAMLNRVEEIDPNNAPKGCILKRSDDWASMEYDVHVAVIERHRGVPTPVLKNIGRIVQYPEGIHAYRVRSGIGHTFQSARDAIAHLVRVVGTSFDEIATAFDEREQMMRKRIARL